MSLIKIYLKELDAEAQTTRKMLSIIPDDKYDWKPHPKSMSIRQLASHIAEMPTWITLAVTTDGIDFAQGGYDPKQLGNTKDLLAYYEQCLADGKMHLEQAEEERLGETWTMRSGADIYSTGTKAETIRMAFSQTIHHRAQLGVFLRLLDIPIPGSYGPSADEMNP